jgi:hypothetical protein
MQRTKRIMLGLGIFLLASSVVLLILIVAGIMQVPEKLFAGESSVHTVARLAVIGCLLAAVGTHE